MREMTRVPRSSGWAIVVPGVMILTATGFCRADEGRQANQSETVRIDSDADKHFGKSPTRIDFETDPQGKRLKVGEDLHFRFVEKGFMLSTSAEDSIVSVEHYNVGGRSGGQCAATLDPVYQGTLTIRFCVPGAETKPAGVHAVGFWISHITVKGTSLVASDEDGKVIAVVDTNKSVRQFLGIHSLRPIARVDVVPDPDIDPDYAIDDLTFDKPMALSP